MNQNSKVNLLFVKDDIFSFNTPEVISNNICEPHKEIAEAFKCGICHFFATNPTQCGECHTYFCIGCLEKWFETNKKSCPLRCEWKEDHTVDRNLPFIHSKLKMKCPNDCPDHIYPQNLEEHLEEKCTKMKYKCLGLNCPFKDSEEEIQTHVETCEFMPIMCKHCFIEYSRGEIESHMKECNLAQNQNSFSPSIIEDSTAKFEEFNKYTNNLCSLYFHSVCNGTEDFNNIHIKKSRFKNCTLIEESTNFVEKIELSPKPPCLLNQDPIVDTSKFKIKRGFIEFELEDNVIFNEIELILQPCKKISSKYSVINVKTSNYEKNNFETSGSFVFNSHTTSIMKIKVLKSISKFIRLCFTTPIKIFYLNIPPFNWDYYSSEFKNGVFSDYANNEAILGLDFRYRHRRASIEKYSINFFSFLKLELRKTRIVKCLRIIIKDELHQKSTLSLNISDGLVENSHQLELAKFMNKHSLCFPEPVKMKYLTLFWNQNYSLSIEDIILI